MVSPIDVFTQVCQIGGLDVGQFTAYANKDKHAGYGTGHYWPGMSISALEGQILYALVRMLRPRRALEIGVWNGCSTCHILQGLIDNDFGNLCSIDIRGDLVPLVPLGLHERWWPRVADALTCRLPEDADFVFEDGAHTYEFTRPMIERLVKINPRVIISHDCLYPDWGHGILDAWRDAGLNPQVVDTGRGMCFWFRGKDET